MLKALIKHPIGLGTLMLVIYPAMLDPDNDIKESVLQFKAGIEKHDGTPIDSSFVTVQGEELAEFLHDGLTNTDLITLALRKLSAEGINYTLAETT